LLWLAYVYDSRAEITRPALANVGNNATSISEGETVNLSEIADGSTSSTPSTTSSKKTRSPMAGLKLTKLSGTKIPCIIHQTWRTNNISEDYMSRSIASWRHQNPQCEHILWTDSDINNFVEDNFPTLLPAEVWQTVTPIQRVDVFKYAVVFTYGGIYADIDVECLVPVQEWQIYSDAELVVGYETAWRFTEKLRREINIARTEQFGPFIFAAVPKHPVMRRCLYLFRQRFDFEIENLIELSGAGLFSDAIKEFLRQSYRRLHNIPGTISGKFIDKKIDWSKAPDKMPLQFPPPGDRALGVRILSAEQVAVGRYGAPPNLTNASLVKHGFKKRYKKKEKR